MCNGLERIGVFARFVSLLRLVGFYLVSAIWVPIIIAVAIVRPGAAYYPLVRAWAQLLREEAERTGAYVLVSGHEASQQYLAVGRQAQLISGTSALEGRPVVRPEIGRAHV